MMKKISKRLFSAILAIVMLVSVIPNSVFKATATTATAQSDYVTGDIITYGSYPQTKVIDLALISALNAQTLQGDNTVTYDGSKYMRAYFTTANDFTNGYEINTVYWFKFEPIQWRVLSNTNNELFVMAEKILDSKAYNQTETNVTWETCTMRTWLNNDFYNTAFNSTEQARIKTSTIVNEDNSSNGTEGGNNTNDKLFLLSYSEVLNSDYGFNSSTSSNAARETQGSDFSKSNGISVFRDTHYYYFGNSCWWLRTPGDHQYSACNVFFNGIISYFVTLKVNFTGNGVRPAFKINLADLNKIITFDANGGLGGKSVTMISGEPLTAPTVERDGFTFTGWSPEVPATVPEADTTYTAQWISNSVTTGDIIEYGSYPQTKITDLFLSSLLDGQTLQADNTVTYSGSKYKRVYFSQYTTYDGGTSSDRDETQQDDNGYYINTVYWFKYEPIQWRVLSNTNGELFVMADNILETRPYNQDNTDVTWEGCTMRSWLNNDFYNTAFNSEERAKIKTSNVVNENGYSGGNNTSDKLFLLSNVEVMNLAYGFNGSIENDATRVAQGTDYSKSQGLAVFIETSYWWLRSPSGVPCSAGVIHYYGYVNCSGNVYYTGIGVRPAYKINLFTNIFTASENSGCKIDYLKKFISGLQPGISSLENIVDVAAGYSIEYVPTPNGFGTGTVVNVVNTAKSAAQNSVVASYTVVIFGDINGDGNIDSIDAGKLVDYENSTITWNPTTDAALFKAGDLNGDGNIDSMDAGIAVDAENDLINIDQATGLVT